MTVGTPRASAGQGVSHGPPDVTSPLDATLDRRAFLYWSAAGVATLAAGCHAPSSRATPLGPGGRVIVVGAGPAGMTAAHRLRQAGVDVVVLEAAPTHGGRIKRDVTFTDFPLSLGAEWVHVGPEILEEIVNDPTIEVSTRLVAYDPDDVVGYYDGELSLVRAGRISDLKFAGSSWLDFFDEYVVPGIADRIETNVRVVRIDYSAPVVRLTDTYGTVHEADRVIVTVPLKVLQRGDIVFEPPLPGDRAETIAAADVWSGLKAFFEFSEPFYPTVLEFAGDDTRAGQRLFYDAAYGQDTDAHILGVFTVGVHAETYQALSSEDLRDRILAELDEVFDGAASATYLRHTVQNWNDEPFAGAAYLADSASWLTSRRLAGAVDGRVVFAGDAYTRFNDWSSVHAAARSAAAAVDELLR